MSSLLAGIPALDAATLAPWRLRLSRRAMGTAGFVILVLAIAAVLVTLDWDAPLTWPAEYVESADNILGSIIFGLFPGAMLVLWIAPRAGVWLAAAPLLLDAALGGQAQVTIVIELGAAFALVTLALIDAAARARQESAARQWAGAPVLVPDGEPAHRGHVQRWRGGWTGLAVALLLVAAVTSVVFVNGHRAAKDFRAGALEATGTVVEVSDDDSRAVVEVDGLRLDVPLPTIFVDEGEVLAVRYDGSGRAEAMDDAADPSGVLVVTTAALTAAVALLLREAQRRRRVTTLLRHGGPAVRLLASWDRRGELQLSPVDAPRRAVAESRALEGLARLRFDVEAPDVDDVEDEEWMRPVGEVSDADLLRRAKQLAEADEIDLEVPHSQPPGTTPDTWQDTEVAAVGFVAAGHPVALRGPDGDWYVTETGISMPARWPWEAKPTTSSTERESSDRDSTDGEESAAESADALGSTSSEPGRLANLILRTSRVGPWILVAVVATLARWLAGDVSWWGTLVGAVVVSTSLHNWSSKAVTPLRIRPRVLVMHHPMIDEHYPWARVQDVVADDEALVVRTSASEVEAPDALLFAPGRGEKLLPGVTDPHQARERLLAARAAGAAHATADTQTRRRPSLPTVVAALGVLAWLGGLLLG